MSCTLEQIFAYPIDFLISCYHQNFKVVMLNTFCSNNNHLWVLLRVIRERLDDTWRVILTRRHTLMRCTKVGVVRQARGLKAVQV